MALKQWLFLALLIAILGFLLPHLHVDRFYISVGPLQIGLDPFVSPLSSSDFSKRANSVTILRDEWGIAHIIGEDDESTIFGMAFAHCEDDFSTFQERRVLFSSLPHYPVHSNNDRGTIFSQKVFLMSRGKLASVFGEEKTKWDFLPQFFGLQNVSEGNHINKISKPMLKIIDAYVDGVNYYAALHWKQVLRPDLFPISRSDIIVGFALKLPGFVKADRFFNFLNQEDPAYMISSRGRYATEQEKSLRDDQGGEPMVIVPSSDLNPQSEEDILQAGSNTWAMNSKRTADHQTFLNINSHLPWTGISAWYEIHAKSHSGWDIYGATLAGFPALLLGFNEHVGWSHTINSPDLVDVYLISPDLQSPLDFYILDNHRVAFEKSLMEFSVNIFNIPLTALGFKRDIPIIWKVQQTLLHTVHGPVFSRPHGLYAFKISQLENSAQMFDQWYQLNRARSVAQVKEALRNQLVPLLNTVSADKHGNILFSYSASLPTDRSPLYLYHSIIDGSESDSLWTGDKILPFDQLPHVENPESGLVQNCNNSPFFHTTADPSEWPRPEAYAHTFPIEKMITNRGQRIYELVSAETNITWDRFIEFKWDSNYATNSHAAEYKQAILEQLPLLGDRGVSWALDPIVPEALQLLATWDLSVNPENRAAGLALLTLSSFIGYHEKDDTAAIRSLRHDPEPILRSFIRIAQQLKEKFGRLDVEYRQVHRLVRGSTVVGMGGGPDVLHCTRSELQLTKDDIYNKIVYGDTVTFLIRWSAEGMIHAEGLSQFGAASTRPESPHYADQVPLMVNKKTRPLYHHLDDIRAHLEREYHPGQ